MAKKCKKEECPAGEKWAAPFADFLSLLLALFIALYAIVSQNKEKIKSYKEEFVKIFDYAPRPDELVPIMKLDPQSTTVTTPQASGDVSGGAVEGMDKLQKIMEDIRKLSFGGGALDQSMDGIVLKLPAAILFNKGEAEIKNDDMKLFLHRVADIIKTLPKEVEISVRGYTDDTPTHPLTGYRDNLELSTSRANNVVRELIKGGIAPDRLSSAGYGEFSPVAPNTDEVGREKNRRVEFYMYTSKEKVNQDNTKRKEDILDKMKGLKSQ